MDTVVVVVAASFGAFARSLTGFGGSILFELVYNLGSEAHVAELSSAVLMVSLACVFEIFTSSVLAGLVFRDAMEQYRLLLCLSVFCLPATLAGCALLFKLEGDREALANLRIGLNVLFLIVSTYKLTTDSHPKEKGLTGSLLQSQKSDPIVLYKQLRSELLSVGLVCGFLNGFVGLPGPVIMAYFAPAMSSGKLGMKEGYAVVQGFFMLTTLFRTIALGASPGMLRAIQDEWALFATLPVPSLGALLLGFWLRPHINPVNVLRAILMLLLVSSLVGTGVLQGTMSGLVSLICTLLWALWLFSRRN